MRVAALVLAAGAGTRLGGPKALALAGHETFLERVARVLWRPGIEWLLVVTGAQAPQVERSCRLPAGTRWVRHAGWQEGMLSSLWSGLTVAEEAGAEALLCHPVDHPLVAPETVDALVTALRAGARVAVPVWQGRRGHPVGFGRESWPALKAADPSLGARSVLQAHPEWVLAVPGDAGCRAGIDTPEDYRRLAGSQTEPVFAVPEPGKTSPPGTR